MHYAIVGTGPTGVYSFQHVMSRPLPLRITLFERGETIGLGMPYSPETASKHMLANIASIEIPPLGQSYLDWLRAQPHEKLRDFGLDPATLDERSFTPRLLLGEYFHDSLAAMIAQARARGVEVITHAGCRVTDVLAAPEGLRLATSPETGDVVYDKVVLATGHAFAQDDDPTDHYFPNPWSGLLQADLPAARVGILGTSLSGIDAAMAVATRHGTFTRVGGGIVFTRNPAATGLKITLMSWSGILPEADFYCPIPYEPLAVMTPAALARAAQSPAPFAAVFALLRDEIAAADPAWAAAVGLEGLDAQGFHDAYFRDRETHDAFDWARANLEEVERNAAARHTVAWRYAILRMHEPVETILPALGKADTALFDATLKKVFVDNYAAVPPDSIRRLLALRDAGVIEVLALGEDYTLTHGKGQSTVVAHGRRHVFDIFIDARGQQAMGSADLPFPSLRAALLAHGAEIPKVGEDYGLLDIAGYAGRLHLAALPVLLRQRPFVQGITACAEIGQTIAAVEASRRRRHRRFAGRGDQPAKAG